jgi:hypothetical protein
MNDRLSLRGVASSQISIDQNSNILVGDATLSRTVDIVSRVSFNILPVVMKLYIYTLCISQQAIPLCLKTYEYREVQTNFSCPKRVNGREVTKERLHPP